MRALVILAVACCFAMPVLAQTRAEQQIRDINRSIESQQRNLREQQNNQFEANQLRQDLSRQRNAPDLTPPIRPGRICAPGQLGC